MPSKTLIGKAVHERIGRVGNTFVKVSVSMLTIFSNNTVNNSEQFTHVRYHIRLRFTSKFRIIFWFGVYKREGYCMQGKLEQNRTKK